MVILKEYEGLTFLEIAQALDVPVSTVKTRLYRGLGQLRLRLERQGIRGRGAGAGARVGVVAGGRTGDGRMECEEIGDELLQADKMDVLYGEADAAVAGARRGAPRGLRRLPRGDGAASRRCGTSLAAWQLPAGRAGVHAARDRRAALARPPPPRSSLGVGLSLGATGYVSLRRALAAQEARAARSRSASARPALALEQALAQPARRRGRRRAAVAGRRARSTSGCGRARRARRSSSTLRLADWTTRAEAQRRVDLARVAAGLSYLDGRHGQQLARTNELMGYVLDATSQKR